MKLDVESYFKFSGGEVHCKLEKSLPGIFTTSGTITCLDYTMNGFMALAETVQILDRRGIHDLVLILPYLPYARQDRFINPDEPFSLKIYAELINSLSFNRVEIYDCHSDVGLALIENSLHIPQWKVAAKVLPCELLADENVLLVSPDAGAYKKVSCLMPDDNRIVLGTKQRDSDGKITKTNIYSPVDVLGKECLIVDDICDGGRTFVELAKILKEKGASKIMLYVTHGIFSTGFMELQKYIDIIYTTNSFPLSDQCPEGYVARVNIV